MAGSQLNPAPLPGDGFVKQSLAEYLALQTVRQQYGPERLKQRLTQRAAWARKDQLRQSGSTPSLLLSRHNDALERGRAALVLNSIAQVWGDKPLSLTISQFYKAALQHPSSATANAFAQDMTQQLPDSLKYLQTYLSGQLEFDFKIGRLANLPNGLAVAIQAAKWQRTATGQRQALPFTDYIPLVVLDKDGRQVHRQLVRPNSDDQFVMLPALPNASKVVIDPLNAWPELNKRDNSKIF